MDLWDSQRLGNYEPFAVLLQLIGGGVSREFYGSIPFISDPPRINGRWITSTLHHELTHLASVRTTRLGRAFSIEGARLLDELRSQPPGDLSHSLTLSEPARKLIGVFYPILEGLALYTELHFDERATERMAPNPITFHAQMVSAARSINDADVHRLAREEAVLNTGQPCPGLLETLFCNHKDPANSYYLVGYLWVRASAALITKACPRLGRPTVMLPLLIKLFCDHPVIAAAWQSSLSAHDILNALRNTIFSMTEEALQRIDAALDDDKLLAEFEIWNLHQFLENSEAARPETTIPEEWTNPFRNEPSAESVLAMRGATSVWISGSVTGELTNINLSETGSATLILRLSPDEAEIETSQTEIENTPPDSDEQEITVYLADLVTVFRNFSRSDNTNEYGSIVARQLENIIKYWELSVDMLYKLIHRKITIATYVCLAAPGTFGTLIWDESLDWYKPFQIPYTPHWFEDYITIETVKGAMELPLTERKKFARTIRLGDADDARDIAVATLLDDLLSDKSDQRDMMQRRLEGLLDKTGQAQLKSWASPPVFRRSPWTIPEDAAEQLDCHIDLPAFRKARLNTSENLRARELFPVLDPSL
jgi:hypothetical protein